VTTLLHVLPVGLSLLNSLDGGHMAEAAHALSTVDGAASADDTVAARLRRASDATTHVLDIAELIGAESLEALAGADAAECSEWTSVRLVASGAAVNSRAYVLIASDTEPGLRAATLVAARYATGSVVRYVADPASGPVVIEPGTVTVYRIPNLDIQRGLPNDLTWRALGAVGHAVATTTGDAIRDRWDVVLHLSGGYKAMVPYLLVMAEGVNSVFRHHSAGLADRQPSLRAVTTHETNKNQLIDVPVRYLDGTLFELAKKLKVHLDGKAWTSDTRRWDLLRGLILDDRHHLTALGTILVNVL